MSPSRLRPHAAALAVGLAAVWLGALAPLALASTLFFVLPTAAGAVAGRIARRMSAIVSLWAGELLGYIVALTTGAFAFLGEGFIVAFAFVAVLSGGALAVTVTLLRAPEHRT